MRKVLHGRIAVEVFSIGTGDFVAHRAGQQDSANDCTRVDGFSSERPDGANHLLLKAVSNTLTVEPELWPSQPKNAGRDRAAGNTADPVEFRKQPRLVQAPQTSKVEQHGSIAATRKAQRNTHLWLSRLVASDQIDRAREIRLIRHLIVPRR